MTFKTTREKAARVGYEGMRAYCESQGNITWLPWDQASNETQTTYRQRVVFILENPDGAPYAKTPEEYIFRGVVRAIMGV